MKNRHILLLLLLPGALVTSCDRGFLDQTVTNDLNEEVVFGDSTYASGFLTQIYTKIGFDTDGDRFNSNGGLQVACDEAEFRASSDISTGMAFATGVINPVIVTDDAWRTCFQQIRACNTFLAKIGGTPMLESTRQQYIAECRFLRAWYYYILVRHYGGVPLQYDNVYIPDNSLIEKDRLRHWTSQYKFLVNKICDYCRDDNGVYPEKVYLTRTAINDGKDFGEKELENIFAQRGFTVFSPEKIFATYSGCMESKII